MTTMLRAALMLAALPTIAGAQTHRTTAAAPKPQPVMYEFKGAKLGMTLADFKVLPVPASATGALDGEHGPIKAYCSDDRDPQGKEFSLFTRGGNSTKPGQLTCRYASLIKLGGDWILYPVSFTIGAHTFNSQTYTFQDGKLIMIDIIAQDEVLADIMDGLTAKWGKWTSETNDTTQNKAGATFPHVVRAWINPLATIRVETPYIRMDLVNVVFADNAAVDRLNAQEKLAHPAADKM